MVRYFAALEHASAVIGNSSSRIIETPSFKVPAVNIGDPQKGRIQAKNMVNCAPNADVIYAAVTKAVSWEFRECLWDTVNSCGDGVVAEEILRARLKTFDKSVQKVDNKGKRAGVEERIHQYPSDISRAEYNLIREDLEGAKKKTRPGEYDLYDVFCAVLYVVQGGIQWRMLPSDYPKWQSVYYHFRIWSEKDETGVSILDKVLQKLVKQIRNDDLRRDKTTFGIVDAQSVQNADTAEEKGYDAGKKYPGSSAMS